MSDLLHISFDKAENDTACLIIMRKNSNGSMTLLKEFYGEEAEALHSFLTKPVILPIKEGLDGKIRSNV